MRVALISDLHGNELALDAVLADVQRRGADRLVCLGDVATLGPRPGAVLDRLRSFGVSVIMGNHDEFLLEPELIRRYTEAPVIVEAVDWCRSVLSSAELESLRAFHRTLRVDLGGGASLLLFHGSPRSHMEDLLATTPAEEVDRLLDGQAATVMAGGHTHVQMLRQHRGILLVNPGSVGLPFQEYVGGKAPIILAHAEYAIVEALAGAVTVSLHRVPLERAALRAAAQSLTWPLGPMLAASYA